MPRILARHSTGVLIDIHWHLEAWYRPPMTCTLVILSDPEVNPQSLVPGIRALQPLLTTPFFDELLLCCPNTAPFRGLGITLVADLLAGMGPLGGIHAALAATPNSQQIVALSSSAPFPSRPTLERLAQHPSGPLVVLLGHPELFFPLPGRYSRRCLKQIRRALLAGAQDLPTLIKALHPTFCAANDR